MELVCARYRGVLILHFFMEINLPDQPIAHNWPSTAHSYNMNPPKRAHICAYFFMCHYVLAIMHIIF